MPENFFANTEKAAIFNIFLSKKNFWDLFFSEKTDLAFSENALTLSLQISLQVRRGMFFIALA